MESAHVVGDMVEATEFPHLAHRYGVMGVPKTIANGKGAVEGAMPEALFLENVLAAVASDAP
jgi:predicted DsbA family dithiol-disulfide isomerase